MKLYRLDISTCTTSTSETAHNACWHIPQVYMLQALKLTPQCNKRQPHQLRLRTEKWMVSLVPAHSNGTQLDQGYNSFNSATVFNWLM